MKVEWHFCYFVNVGTLRCFECSSGKICIYVLTDAVSRYRCENFILVFKNELFFITNKSYLRNTVSRIIFIYLYIRLCIYRRPVFKTQDGTRQICVYVRLSYYIHLFMTYIRQNIIRILFSNIQRVLWRKNIFYKFIHLL